MKTKEIGSFFELEINTGHEYHNEIKYGDGFVARLNSGRAAIYQSIIRYGVKRVYMPRYQCDSVMEILLRNGINIIFYNIDEYFKPQIQSNEKDSAFVIVNYFGIFSREYIHEIAKRYCNTIIDNTQAFFAKPLDNAYNCYSARKWAGVPDGAYLIGESADIGLEKLEQDYSSDTALYLLQRIEYGCEGKAYQNRKINEKRLDDSNVKKMSNLTRRILDGIDISAGVKKRLNNFNCCRRLFDGINQIKIDEFYDDNCVPYVYPLLIEKDGIIEIMHKNKIFQGHWWEYLVDITEEHSFEHKLSKYIIPITIDHRYGEEDMIKQYNVIMSIVEGQ